MVADMTETFTTISGSIYEIDFAGERVRRLTGQEEPTARQPKDGEWKSYVHVIPVLMTTDGGYGMFFDWTGRGNGTHTSQVDVASPAVQAFVDGWGHPGTVLAYIQERGLTPLSVGSEYEEETL